MTSYSCQATSGLRQTPGNTILLESNLFLAHFPIWSALVTFSCFGPPLGQSSSRYGKADIEVYEAGVEQVSRRWVTTCLLRI